ncbi:MAG: sulfotransferase family protein [Saprospiraceae bacterium]
MVQLIWVSLPEFENQEYKKALSILGYKVYGNTEIFKNEGHIELWNDQLLGKKKLNWGKVFEGYDAIIQSPPTMYYEDILKNYPKALVVMEVIDSDIWYKRVKRVKRFFSWLPVFRVFPKIRRYLSMMDKMFFILFKNDLSAINAQIIYNDYINKVKKVVPPKQLLIISPENGWTPICSFLNKPIPTEKFPTEVNKKELNNTAISFIVSVFKRNSTGLILYFGTLISLFIYLLFFY